MDVSIETSYQPPSGFVEDKRNPLVDIELTDSTELWLFQWPINHTPDFNGQRLSLKLEANGHMGTLEESSGKSYDVVSVNSQGPDATVFLSSPSEAKIAGKICRRVSLIHYPEPSELRKRNNLGLSHPQRSSMATSTMSGRRSATPSRSIRPKTSQGMSGYSTPSSRTKSTVSGYVEPSKSQKRKRGDSSVSHSAQDSGKASTGSHEKSKKKKKVEK